MLVEVRGVGIGDWPLEDDKDLPVGGSRRHVKFKLVVVAAGDNANRQVVASRCLYQYIIAISIS